MISNHGSAVLRLAGATGLLVAALIAGPVLRAAAQSAPAPGPTALAPFRVVGLELGKAVGADKKITDATARFDPADTIFASALSEGASPRVTLVGRWSKSTGAVVAESKQTIAPLKPSATAFHVSRPGGWDPGKYKIEILIDGKVVAVKEFEVTD